MRSALLHCALTFAVIDAGLVTNGYCESVTVLLAIPGLTDIFESYDDNNHSYVRRVRSYKFSFQKNQAVWVKLKINNLKNQIQSLANSVPYI